MTTTRKRPLPQEKSNMLPTNKKERKEEKSESLSLFDNFKTHVATELTDPKRAPKTRKNLIAIFKQMMAEEKSSEQEIFAEIQHALNFYKDQFKKRPLHQKLKTLLLPDNRKKDPGLSLIEIAMQKGFFSITHLFFTEYRSSLSKNPRIAEKNSFPLDTILSAIENSCSVSALKYYVSAYGNHWKKNHSELISYLLTPQNLNHDFFEKFQFLMADSNPDEIDIEEITSELLKLLYKPFIKESHSAACLTEPLKTLDFIFKSESFRTNSLEFIQKIIHQRIIAFCFPTIKNQEKYCSHYKFAYLPEEVMSLATSKGIFLTPLSLEKMIAEPSTLAKRLDILAFYGESKQYDNELKKILTLDPLFFQKTPFNQYSIFNCLIKSIQILVWHEKKWPTKSVEKLLHMANYLFCHHPLAQQDTSLAALMTLILLIKNQGEYRKHQISIAVSSSNEAKEIEEINNILADTENLLKSLQEKIIANNDFALFIRLLILCDRQKTKPIELSQKDASLELAQYEIDYFLKKETINIQILFKEFLKQLNKSQFFHCAQEVLRIGNIDLLTVLIKHFPITSGTESKEVAATPLPTSQDIAFFNGVNNFLIRQPLSLSLPLLKYISNQKLLLNPEILILDNLNDKANIDTPERLELTRFLLTHPISEKIINTFEMKLPNEERISFAQFLLKSSRWFPQQAEILKQHPVFANMFKSALTKELPFALPAPFSAVAHRLCTKYYAAQPNPPTPSAPVTDDPEIEKIYSHMRNFLVSLNVPILSQFEKKYGETATLMALEAKNSIGMPLEQKRIFSSPLMVTARWLNKRIDSLFKIKEPGSKFSYGHILLSLWMAASDATSVRSPEESQKKLLLALADTPKDINSTNCPILFRNLIDTLSETHPLVNFPKKISPEEFAITFIEEKFNALPFEEKITLLLAIDKHPQLVLPLAFRDKFKQEFLIKLTQYNKENPTTPFNFNLYINEDSLLFAKERLAFIGNFEKAPFSSASPSSHGFFATSSYPTSSKSFAFFTPQKPLALLTTPSHPLWRTIYTS